jgi:hypothetical protein
MRRRGISFKSKFPNWTQSLKELKVFFDDFELRFGFEELEIKPRPWLTIRDVSKFLEATFATCENYKNNPYFDPCLESLYHVKEALETLEQTPYV